MWRRIGCGWAGGLGHRRRLRLITAFAAQEERGGFGLFSIRERLEMFGERLEVESVPGEGPKFMIEVPRRGRPSRGAGTAPGTMAASATPDSGIGAEESRLGVLDDGLPAGPRGQHTR